MANKYYLQNLVTTVGQYTYPQTNLALDLQSRISKLEQSLEFINSNSNLPVVEKTNESKYISQMVGFLYDHSNIKQRHFETSLEECQNRIDWYKVVNESTLSMAKRALRKLVESNADLRKCDGLITVSSTYNGFPGLSRNLQEEFSLSEEILCYDLTALGCIGFAQGVFLAQTLIQTGRCNNVCVLCVDSMGSHGLTRKLTKIPTMSNVVGYCLSSDGAAALIIGKDSGTNPIFAYKDCFLLTKLWRNSLQLNVLSADEENQPFIWVGKEIQTRLLDEISGLITENMLKEPMFFHPGGVALMKIIRDRYPSLTESTLLSVSELEEVGNIGSPSVMFVLKKAIDKKYCLLPCLRLMAFGPGKVTAILQFDKTEIVNN